jgi:hypothetical protein
MDAALSGFFLIAKEIGTTTEFPFFLLPREATARVFAREEDAGVRAACNCD